MRKNEFVYEQCDLARVCVMCVSLLIHTARKFTFMRAANTGSWFSGFIFAATCLQGVRIGVVELFAFIIHSCWQLFHRRTLVSGHVLCVALCSLFVLFRARVRICHFWLVLMPHLFGSFSVHVFSVCTICVLAYNLTRLSANNCWSLI